MIQGLTSNDPPERVQLFRWLLKMQCGNGLMHESVDVNDVSKCTRPWYDARVIRRFKRSRMLLCSQGASKATLSVARNMQV